MNVCNTEKNKTKLGMNSNSYKQPVFLKKRSQNPPLKDKGR